jgi:hypothetical protein
MQITNQEQYLLENIVDMIYARVQAMLFSPPSSGESIN